MRYNFQCTCGLVFEHIQPITDNLPDTLPCPKCEAESTLVISAPMIAKTGMTHEPFDIAVGRDAEVRWSDIKRRQDLRTKVRKESGIKELSMTGRNEFKPLMNSKLTAVEISSDKVRND